MGRLQRCVFIIGYLLQMITKEMFEEGLKDLVENEVCIVTNKIVRMLTV